MNRFQTRFLFALAAVTLAAPIFAQETPGKHDGKTVAQWIALAENGDDDQRRQAYYALGEIRPTTPEAAAALTAGLEDGAIIGRRYAAAALGEMGPLAAPAVPALIEAIESETVRDAYIQLHSVRTLGRIGPEAAAALPLLRQQATSPSAELRVAASLSIWQIAQDREAIAALIKELEQPAAEAPFAAALAFLEIGPTVEEALPALVQALAHEDPDVRRAAAKAAAAYRLAAAPLIAEQLKPAGGANRQAAVTALGFIFDQARNETLYNTQTTPDDFMQAARTLIQVGAAAAASVMTNPQASTSERTAAMRALAKLGPLAVVALLSAVDHKNEAVQAAALEGMQRVERYLPRKPTPNIESIKMLLAGSRTMPSGAVVNGPLIAPLASDNPQVRKATIHLFAALEIGPYGKAAIPALRKALRDETDGGIRGDASRALNRLIE